MADVNEIVDEFVRAFNERDVDGVMALVAADAEMTWIPVGRFSGAAAIRKEMDELLTAFPDFTRTPGERHVAGNTVTIQYQASGTFDGGPFAGLEPTGKQGTIDVCDVITIEDGKVAESTVYWDGMQMARELGLMPAEGSTGDKAFSAVVNFATRAKKRLKR